MVACNSTWDQCTLSNGDICCEGGILEGGNGGQFDAFRACVCPSPVTTPAPEERERGNVATQLAVFLGLVIILLFMCQRVARCRNNGRRRYESSGRGSRGTQNQQAVAAELSTKADICKASLVADRATPDDQCCVCLSPFDEEADDAVHPAGCTHYYHRACIEEWIDQVRTKSVVERDRETRDQVTRRMLSCPICARPFVVEVLEEEEEEDHPPADETSDVVPLADEDSNVVTLVLEDAERA